MSLLEDLRLGVRNPALLGRKFNQVLNRSRMRRSFNPRGIDIFAQDWDTLIILDACRFDLFESVCNFPGKLSAVESRGAATAEWLAGNCTDRKLWDVVYVTANPMLYRKQSEINVEFHDVLDIWNGDAWDDDVSTVPPDAVTERAIEAAETHPNKRLLIHFVQPHYPFLGSTTEFDKGHMDPDRQSGLTTWMQVMTGRVDATRDELWQLYEENLRQTLPAVEELVDTLDGKTVVSSDHGNMFGERAAPIPIREWGHPPGIYTDELVTVPWLEVEFEGPRRNVTGEPPVSDSKIAEQSATERLEDLGYLS